MESSIRTSVHLGAHPALSWFSFARGDQAPARRVERMMIGSRIGRRRTARAGCGLTGGRCLVSRSRSAIVALPSAFLTGDAAEGERDANRHRSRASNFASVPISSRSCRHERESVSEARSFQSCRLGFLFTRFYRWISPRLDRCCVACRASSPFFFS